ncbi:hypothetical protein ANANG_G00189910 [Anguilla anguilla]|uniref:Beta-microseminoprotein n=1 Tax=Anguilla anguilla TaxID=7936 RepID=A0A9D3M0X1_ANGAN|nr:hypothetical protein ANANG_G00189910 [Anguilla anguilla]
MKYLALALLLCTQLHLLHGACFNTLPTLSDDLSGCVDKDGTVRPLDSTWRNSDCQDCTCDGCCDAFSTPVSIPDDCTMEFDKKECKYNVFKKNDHAVPCEVGQMIG